MRRAPLPLMHALAVGSVSRDDTSITATASQIRMFGRIFNIMRHQNDLPDLSWPSQGKRIYVHVHRGNFLLNVDTNIPWVLCLVGRSRDLPGLPSLSLAACELAQDASALNLQQPSPALTGRSPVLFAGFLFDTPKDEKKLMLKLSSLRHPHIAQYPNVPMSHLRPDAFIRSDPFPLTSYHLLDHNFGDVHIQVLRVSAHQAPISEIIRNTHPPSSLAVTASNTPKGVPNTRPRGFKRSSPHVAGNIHGVGSGDERAATIPGFITFEAGIPFCSSWLLSDSGLRYALKRARRHAPSPYPSPPNKYTGRIQVRNSEGNSLGYLKNWAGPSPMFVRSASQSILVFGIDKGIISNGVNFGGEDEELHVVFTVAPGKKGPFDIKVTNPNFDAPFYAGVSSSISPGETLATGQPNGIAFVNVQETPPDSPPVYDETAKAYIESSIWYFDYATKQVIPQYINPDGSKAPTTIAYNIRSNQIVIVGDLGAWNSQHSNTPSSAVTLHLEEL
ncbi:hypothetical protein ONZ45_g6036 [Pleurotus djamor]|nr:hypothetical protein ONZ45_g6036 [Pleurotus djamor]